MKRWRRWRHGSLVAWTWIREHNSQMGQLSPASDVGPPHTVWGKRLREESTKFELHTWPATTVVQVNSFCPDCPLPLWSPWVTLPVVLPCPDLSLPPQDTDSFPIRSRHWEKLQSVLIQIHAHWFFPYEKGTPDAHSGASCSLCATCASHFFADAGAGTWVLPVTDLGFCPQLTRGGLLSSNPLTLGSWIVDANGCATYSLHPRRSFSIWCAMCNYWHPSPFPIDHPHFLTVLNFPTRTMIDDLSHPPYTQSSSRFHGPRVKSLWKPPLGSKAVQTFKPRNTASVVRRLKVGEVATRSSYSSCTCFRLFFLLL
jgi:hypothetical protein